MLEALPAVRLRYQTRQRYADQSVGPFVRYRFEPASYIIDKLDWKPWSGSDEHPGQVEILDAYTLALRQQHERDDYESGRIGEDALTYWRPGQPIQNRIRVEAGHTVGKTKLASGIVNHFFDCFPPAIVYTFAPGWKQIHDLLWKEIKTDRIGKGLPGRVLDLGLHVAPNHFANGLATNNAGGHGTERVQGQHGPYLLFVLDEAEGIDDYVWSAIDSMASGGIVIILMLANPRTRVSKFHKAGALPDVRSLRLSCIWHPNVLEGREIVPGAVRRDYVDSMIATHCEIVTAHDHDEMTFEVPWRPGLIFKPDAEMMFRVLGVAPKNLADNTFVPVGRYEAAVLRPPEMQQPMAVRIGVDCARFGKDAGTVYVRHDGATWREAKLPQKRTGDYVRAIKDVALRLAGDGGRSLHVRVDGGGGFGGGVIDALIADLELEQAFAEVVIVEVLFNGIPSDRVAYADLATEMYAESAETLHSLAILDPPPELEADLCERTYRWANWKGYDVKEIVSKDVFRKEHHRSPDDGDGFVLAVSPDHIFFAPQQPVVTHADPVEISPY